MVIIFLKGEFVGMKKFCLGMLLVIVLLVPDNTIAEMSFENVDHPLAGKAQTTDESLKKG